MLSNISKVIFWCAVVFPVFLSWFLTWGISVSCFCWVDFVDWAYSDCAMLNIISRNKKAGTRKNHVILNCSRSYMIVSMYNTTINVSIVAGTVHNIKSGRIWLFRIAWLSDLQLIYATFHNIVKSLLKVHPCRICRQDFYAAFMHADYLDHVIYSPPQRRRGKQERRIKYHYVDIICVGILVK